MMPFRGGSDMTWINDRNPAAINAMARAKVLHDAKKVHSHTYRGWTGGDVYRGLTKSEVDSILPKLSKEQDAWDEVNAYESLPSDKNVFEQILEAVKGEPASESAVNDTAELLGAASRAGAPTDQVASVIADSIQEAVAESASSARPDGETEGDLETVIPRPMAPRTPQPKTPAARTSTTEPALPFGSPALVDPNQLSPRTESVDFGLGFGVLQVLRSAIDSLAPAQLEEGMRSAVKAAAPAASLAEQAMIQQRATQIAYRTFNRFDPTHASRVFRPELKTGRKWRYNRPGYPQAKDPGMSPSSYYLTREALVKAGDEEKHAQLMREADGAIQEMNEETQRLRGQGFTMTRRRRVGGLGTVTAPRSSVSRAAVPGRKGSKDAALYRKLRKAFLPTNMGWYYEPRRPGASNYLDAEEIKRARWGRPWRHFRSTAPHNLTHMIPLKVLNPRLNISVAPPPLPTSLIESQVRRISGMGKRQRSRSVHQRRVR